MLAYNEAVGFNILGLCYPITIQTNVAAFAVLLKLYGTKNPNESYLIYFVDQKIDIML